jgi:PAS domain-containing protein
VVAHAPGAASTPRDVRLLGSLSELASLAHRTTTSLDAARTAQRESQQLEATLRQSELQVRRLLDALPVSAYTCDAEGLITYHNEQAVRLWGRAPKLRHPSDRYCGSFKLFSVDGAPMRHDQCWMARAIQGDQSYHAEEIVIERPDGSRVAALAHASPIHDEAGALLGAVNIWSTSATARRPRKP